MFPEPQWNQHRRPLNSAFAYKVLLNFIPIFNKESTQLLLEINQRLSDGQLINLLPILQRYSLTIATSKTKTANLQTLTQISTLNN